TARWRDRIRHPWSRPRFFYYQLMEPHSPYDPQRESHDPGDVAFTRALGAGDASRAAAVNRLLMGMRWEELGPREVGLLESLYDIEVALVDRRLERLFAGLERRGVLERAVVVVTADH